MSSESTSNKRKRSSEPETSIINPTAESQQQLIAQTDKTEAAAEETTTTTTQPTPPHPEAELEEPVAKSAKLSPVETSPPSDVEDGEISDNDEDPPLPNEAPPDSTHEQPPLPTEPLPAAVLPPSIDDGWEPIWDGNAQTYYFYNRFTQKSQWDNPRLIPSTSTSISKPTQADTSTTTGAAGRYNPAIHGDYDPNADYAQLPPSDAPSSLDPTSNLSALPSSDPASYAATATFNRFTGRYQAAALAPENFNDDNKSKRQMNAFFDVDQAANSHGGRSLKAERQGQKLSKKELKELKEKQRRKKETKQRAWLMD